MRAAITDLIAGQVQITFVPPPAVIEQIRAGKLRAIGVTGSQRLNAVPDAQPVSELVADYEASNWYGLYAPKNTPPEIVTRLNAEINDGLAAPDLRARVVELGGTPAINTLAAFKSLVVRETDKWAKVVKFANIKPD